MLLLGKVKISPETTSGSSKQKPPVAAKTMVGRETSLKWVQVKIKELRIDNRKDFVKYYKMYVI